MLLVEETDRRLQRKLYTVPMVDEITFDASRFLGNVTDTFRFDRKRLACAPELIPVGPRVPVSLTGSTDPYLIWTTYSNRRIIHHAK